MEASFWIEEEDGQLYQRIAGRKQLDEVEARAVKEVKRVILHRRAEEFASHSVFEWIMGTDG